MAASEAWRTTGWNGVRFDCPSAWQVVRIGPRYLLLEDDAGPVMEIKWAPIRGKFSHERHFKQLAAAHPKPLRASLVEQPLGPDWQNALKGFYASGFSWQGRPSSGSGVIAFCPVCRSAAIVQFFHPVKSCPKARIARILSSFRDHAEDGQTLWSLYDIRIVAPDSLRLARHRFEAGSLCLTLEMKGLNVTYHRWSPASVILAGTGLAEFGKSQIFPRESADTIVSAPDQAEWRLSRGSTWDRLRRRWKKKWPFGRGRVWRIEDQNRILGVLVEGRRIIEDDLFDLFCGGHGLV